VIRDQKGPGPKFGKDAKGNSAYVVPAKRKPGEEASPPAEERKRPENDKDKAREHEFKKLRQRELEIEKEREREREKEKEREKARQRERERIDRERIAKGLPPSSPSSNLSRSAASIANLAEEGTYNAVRSRCECVLTHSVWRTSSYQRTSASALVSQGIEPVQLSLPSALLLHVEHQRSYRYVHTCLHSCFYIHTLYNSARTYTRCTLRSLCIIHIHEPLAANTQDGSPAAAAAAGNLDPDDPQYIEKLRVRQNLLAEMRSQGVEPRAVRAWPTSHNTSAVHLRFTLITVVTDAGQ
jgi:hypothetical protein